PPAPQAGALSRLRYIPTYVNVRAAESTSLPRMTRPLSGKEADLFAIEDLEESLELFLHFLQDRARLVVSRNRGFVRGGRMGHGRAYGRGGRGGADLGVGLRAFERLLERSGRDRRVHAA